MKDTKDKGPVQTIRVDTKPRLHAGRLRDLAVKSSSDPRSVAREYQSPGSVRGLAGDRIRHVLRLEGLIGVAREPSRRR